MKSLNSRPEASATAGQIRISSANLNKTPPAKVGAGQSGHIEKRDNGRLGWKTAALSSIFALANMHMAQGAATKRLLNDSLGGKEDCERALLSPGPYKARQDSSAADYLYSPLHDDICEMRDAFQGENSKGVHYLNPEERLKCMVGLSEGKLIDGYGEPYDTTGLDQDDVIFVLDTQKNLFISPISPAGLVQHSSLVAGEPVLMAGTISVKDGVPVVISNESGHYLPEEKNMELFLQHLRDNNVDLSGTSINLFT